MKRPSEDFCRYFHDHTPSPGGYIQWHEWAKRKARTHRQEKCSGCERYVIWVPRRTALSEAEGGK